MTEKRGRYILDFIDTPSQRQPMPELEVEKRIDNFEEVELGFTQEQAIAEAKRCLSCRRCLGCALCLAVCEPNAIVFEQEDESIDLIVDEVIIAPEVERYMPVKKGEFGFREHFNVLNAFEFERYLAENGPSGGLILRPFDGEIPANIAFIVDDNKNSNPLISYILKEAALALKKTSDLKISIFVTDQENIKKEIPEGISIRKATITEVKEIEETKNLMVSFNADGENREEEYGMVVIAKKPEISTETKELCNKLDLKSEDTRLPFWDTEQPALIQTSIPNVSLCLSDLTNK